MHDLPSPDLAEIIQLYGLLNWVERSYKQTKGALGWSHYQVRSDPAIQRHWTLVCCAFSFCWYQQSRARPGTDRLAETDPAPKGEVVGGGGNRAQAAASPQHSWPAALWSVRAWLEPCITLWRYWRAWSSRPPPAPLQRLL